MVRLRYLFTDLISWDLAKNFILSSFFRSLDELLDDFVYKRLSLIIFGLDIQFKRRLPRKRRLTQGLESNLGHSIRRASRHLRRRVNPDYDCLSFQVDCQRSSGRCMRGCGCRKISAAMATTCAPGEAVPLEIRVGVNAGEVVIRSISAGDEHVEYTPIGHTSNLASRMQTIARSGFILASEHTQRLIEGYFQSRALSTISAILSNV